ncbi:hypothetical protein L21TH_2284 [Caldisalinibacter kiritimatiensis]|uniref:Uncharacterized protein n=1 Tax=Caldisalinibacter kiritimatiensis TaxID=1304284 RepID=R1ASK1_9FIRM|nr:hypothetical protein L21TH_2284 [Caldisalinibacter kiritimatiensis]
MQQFAKAKDRCSICRINDFLPKITLTTKHTKQADLRENYVEKRNIIIIGIYIATKIIWIND